MRRAFHKACNVLQLKRGPDAIDVEGLAFNTSSSTLSWTQKATGTKASGTLTVKEGSQTQSFTLVGSTHRHTST
jgi:hypothetical protein